MMNQENHWEQVYATRQTERLGWYKSRLRISLSWIEALDLVADAPIIDVGGGVSTLVDDLLNDGYKSITVLDISEAALSSVRERLGKNAEQITWLNGDITSVALPTDHYELWHDRAVFHFLTEIDQQRKYRDNLLSALKPGGHLIMSTFAPEAPPKCSGLPVQRYSQEQLEDMLGAKFKLMHSREERHVTPGGVEQMYICCNFRRVD